MKQALMQGLLLALLLNATTAQASGKRVEVHFLAGERSAHYHGAITGYDYDRYYFHARQGQALQVTPHPESVDVYLFGPQIADSVNLSEYATQVDEQRTYRLPASGRFEMRVVQSRADARRGRVQPYRLTIAIDALASSPREMAPTCRAPKALPRTSDE